MFCIKQRFSHKENEVKETTKTFMPQKYSKRLNYASRKEESERFYYAYMSKKTIPLI